MSQESSRDIRRDCVSLSAGHCTSLPYTRIDPLLYRWYWLYGTKSAQLVDSKEYMSLRVENESLAYSTQIQYISAHPYQLAYVPCAHMCILSSREGCH
jgi:hypothetical protein